MIRVAIVYDHLVVQEGLRKIIDDSEDMSAVLVADTYRELLSYMKMNPVDVALINEMDADFPVFYFFKKLMDIPNLCRIIVFAQRDEIQSHGDEDVYGVYKKKMGLDWEERILEWEEKEADMLDAGADALFELSEPDPDTLLALIRNVVIRPYDA